MKNILFIVFDGLGDRPIPEFGGLTPLECARTPNLDRLTTRAICGQLYAVGPGIRPSSDVAHMNLFGLDHTQYYTGRGPIELIGLNETMGETDIAWRGNFCSLNENGIITDRRIGRKTPPKEVLELLKEITIKGITFRLCHIAEHRFSLKASGKCLSANITDSDPHIENVLPLEVKPRDQSENAFATAKIVNEYLCTVTRLLSESETALKMGINAILLRSVGARPQWPSLAQMYGFKNSCCIANNALYNGVAKLLGMKISSYHHYENYLDYYDSIQERVQKELRSNDFVFLHIQEGDLFGEDGNYREKKNAIEKMDSTLYFLNELDPDETLIVMTADHSTPCPLKGHSGDSVPLVISGSGVRNDTVSAFGERACTGGVLGTVLGKDLMQIIVNLFGTAKLIGG